MFLLYFNVILFISFCSFSWIDTIKNDDIWLWKKTKYLTRSNWSSLLIPNDNSSDHQHSVWFIFHYLNYCEYCKQAEPAWESIARYAINWSKYIQIGAYDCANDIILNNDICQDEKYPQWRIYCPLTNSTQLAFHSNQRTDQTTSEDILIWLLEKLNTIADQCYGKSWPIQDEIQANIKDDLNEIIPKEINQFQLFISNDILQYTLYVLNNSKMIQIEPIYRLAKQNQIIKDNGIWKGIRDTNGQISLEFISKELIKPFILDKILNIYPVETVEEKNLSSIKPTLSDIDSAVIWMINRDLRRSLPDLIEEVKAWINVLYIYYPGSDDIKNFLYDLKLFLDNRTTISSSEFLNYTNSTSFMRISELKFKHCNGSDSSKRGYPCTLWVLFHSMTIKQAILAEKNRLSSNVKPSDLIISIREFIRNFYLCEECVRHFVNMTSNVTNEIKSFTESVLFLWQSHNIVNQRLRNDEFSTDPNWPKVPFPSKQQCDKCVQQIDENGDAFKYNDNEIYQFLINYYSQNSTTNLRFNYVLLFLILSLYYLIIKRSA